MINAIQNLVFLSKRASQRRQLLGLSAKELSAQLGIPYTTIKNWEASLPQKPVADVEKHWEEVLRVPYGWLRNPSIKDDAPIALARDNTVTLSDMGLTTVAQEIAAVATWLSRSLETTRTFNASLLSTLEARRAEIFATRYGIWGKERTTLSMIADEHKLTRERIRKIIEPMVQRSIGVTFVLPTLERVRQVASSTGAISVRDFNELHREYLGKSLSFDDADRFAREIAGYALANQWEKSLIHSTNAITPMLGDDNTGHLAHVVREAAIQMCRSCGAANVKFVLGMVAQKIGTPITADSVKNCINSIEGLQWIGSESAWFWFGPKTKNFAINSVKRMLQASTGPIEVEILHEGMCRARRQPDEASAFIADVELPLFVLKKIIEQIPWIKRHHHNQITLSKIVLTENILTDSEKLVINAIRDLGGLVNRNMLIEKIVDTNKITTSTLQAILSTAPFIRHHSSGKYELRDYK